MTRDERILRAWNCGQTAAAIAEEHGLTRQRVSQIILRFRDAGRVVTDHPNRGNPDGIGSPGARAAARASRRSKNDDLRGVVLGLRAAGVGPRKIARWLGVTPGVVAGLIHRGVAQ